MASPKKAYSDLGKTAKYYRNNPSARKKKASTDKKINARPAQRKKRSALVKARRKRGIYGNGDKRDLHHSKNGLKLESMKKNRGNSTTTQGDRNSRKKGVKKK